MALLDDIKTELGIGDASQDALINLYIRKATTLIQNYLNIPTVAYTDSTGTVIQPIDVPTTYPDAVTEYVIYRMNRRGNEGLKQFTQGSRSGTYDTGSLPESVTFLLPAPFAKLLQTTPVPTGVILP